MDSEQIDKRLSWFDEQRLKDAESLRVVQQTIKELEKSIGNQAKQIETLSEETARVAALATRIHQVDEALGKHRKEVARQLEVAESRRSEKEKHHEALRKTDQEAIVKRIDALRTELEQLDGIHQALETRRDEQNRLNKEIDVIKKHDDKVQVELRDLQVRIKSLDDAQQKDRKRIGQYEGEAADFKRRLDSARHQIDALTDDIRRIDLRTTELVTSEEERREGQSVFFDRQELKLVEFEKSWGEWAERFEEFEKSAASMSEKLIAYDETFRSVRQLRESLEGLMEKLERRITEVSEMQRLADERIKQEWNSFQADEHKRWNTFKLTNDEQWRDHTRAHTRLDDHQETAEQQIQVVQQALAEIRELDETRIRELVAVIRDWAAALDQRK